MKKLLVILIVGAASLALSGCSLNPSALPSLNQELLSSPSSEINSDVEATDSTQVFEQSSTQHQLLLTAIQDGQTAFDLLQSEAQAEYKEYDFGIFIESINGTKADDQHYWAFYVNDEYAQTAVDKTVLDQGDQVLFTYETL